MISIHTDSPVAAGFAGSAMIQYLRIMFFVPLISLCLSSSIRAETSIYSFDPGGPKDYFQELLKLVLDQSKPEYGPYTRLYKNDLTDLRVVNSLKQEAYHNGVVTWSTSVEERKSYGLIAHNFPLLRGMLGYRLCIVSNAHRGELHRQSTLEELRSISQGVSEKWYEGEIFRHNGFEVLEARTGSNNRTIGTLYKMLAGNRFGMLCRGITELGFEAEVYGHIEGIHLQPDIALYYDLPFNFHVPETNPELLRRLALGLNKSLADGSFITLWRKHYQSTVESTQFDRRTVYELENPRLQDLDKSFRQHLYHLKKTAD